MCSSITRDFTPGLRSDGLSPNNLRLNGIRLEYQYQDVGHDEFEALTLSKFDDVVCRYGRKLDLL